MKRFISIAILLSLFAYCSTYQPVQPKIIKTSETFSAPIKKVWNATIQYFAENNVPIENMDREGYFIKTRNIDITTSFGSEQYANTNIPLKNEWCECGGKKLFNVWSTKNQIFFSYNVILRSSSPDSTNATVNVYFDCTQLGRRELFASGYDVDIKLQCVSTGVLENSLFDYISKNVVQ